MAAWGREAHIIGAGQARHAVLAGRADLRLLRVRGEGGGGGGATARPGPVTYARAVIYSEAIARDRQAANIWRIYSTAGKVDRYDDSRTRRRLHYRWIPQSNALGAEDRTSEVGARACRVLL